MIYTNTDMHCSPFAPNFTALYSSHLCL